MNSKIKNVKIIMLLTSMIVTLNSSVIFSSAMRPSSEFTKDDLDSMFSELDFIVSKAKSSNISDLELKGKVNRINELFKKLKILNQKCNQCEYIFNKEVGKYREIQQKLNQANAECEKAKEAADTAEINSAETNSVETNSVETNSAGELSNNISSAQTSSQNEPGQQLRQDMDRKKDILKTALAHSERLKLEKQLVELKIDEQLKSINQIQLEISVVTREINELVNSGR